MQKTPTKWSALRAEIRRRHVVRVTVAYVVVAIAFLQGADVVLPSLLDDADAVMRVLVILFIAGLPVVLTLGWVYDLTPWGVQKTPPMPLPEDARVLEVSEKPPAPKDRGDPHSIAVLPFVDRSADKDQEYFADGVAEELINQLGRRTDLRVVARTSSFAHRGEGRDIREIGGELGVDAVLEGSVRKAGGRLRISAQLVSVSDGYQIWAQRFDREEGDIFSIQDEIATSVTEKLRAALRPGVPQEPEGPGTDNVEAYDLYLKGRHFWTRRYRLGLQHALEYFSRSAALDPDFPLPHAGIADVHTVFGIYSFMPGAMAETQAVSAATRALELGPKQPESHVAYGRAVGFFRWAWQEAEEHHAVALHLDPADGELTASAAQLSAFRGRIEEALERAESALQLAPDSSFAGAMVGAVYLYVGEVERALEFLRRSLDRDREHTPYHYVLGAGLVGQGRPDEAVPILEEAVMLTHRALPFVAALGSAYAASGRTADAEALLDEVGGRAAKEYVTPVVPSMIRAALGDLDTAFDLFQKGMTESRATVTQTIREPIWRPLWKDARWRQILDQMGLSPLG